jgi:RNA polymerase sigma factor (sigma-70 family)
VRLSPSLAILRTQPDERLVALARAGSEAAFAAIIERYRREMLRACRRLLPEARAEDAAQQAFISAWTAIQRGDVVLNVAPWLMTIARNTALNALRVQGYEYDELRESLGVSEAPERELERREVMRQTLAGLASLPERQRQALLRSAVEGTPQAEIARAMGLSDGAVRQLVVRARASLRSAAAAAMPAPLIGWAAAGHGGSAGTSDLVERVGALVAGSGAGAVVAKAGVVAVVAGTIAVAPSLVHHHTARAGAESAPQLSRDAAAGSHRRSSQPRVTARHASAPTTIHPATVAVAATSTAKHATGRNPHTPSSQRPEKDRPTASSDSAESGDSAVTSSDGDGASGDGSSTDDGSSSSTGGDGPAGTDGSGTDRAPQDGQDGATGAVSVPAPAVSVPAPGERTTVEDDADG